MLYNTANLRVLGPMMTIGGKNAFVLLLALCCCLVARSVSAGGAIGDVAPNWILMDQKGAPVSLYQEADAGKTTVMFFWASWCKSCNSLMPVIRQLDQAKGERPIQFYLMNVWEDDDPQAFLQKHQMTLPVLLQAENVAQRYNIRITPGIVVVDPERRIRYVRSPQQGVAEIAAELQKVLGIRLAGEKPTGLH